MRLASISEFGAFDGETGRVREDLRAWVDRRASGGLKSAPYYAYTMGSADLVEVTVFDDHRHLSEMGASSVQAFQRSVGTLCPSQDDLPKLGDGVPVELRSIAALEESGGTPPPLVAFTYLKLGPLAALFVDDALDNSEGGPLARALTPFGPKRPIWAQYQAVIELNGVLGEPKVQVIPLVGIDTVEWVIVTRCTRVEHIASLAWCLRQSRLVDWWPEHVSAPRRDLLARMLRRPEEEVARAWERTPAFAGTTTVLGFDEFWATGTKLPVGTAAAHGLLTQRRTFVPGSFGRAWSSDPGPHQCWMLFDRADLLLPGGHEAADGAALEVRDSREEADDSLEEVGDKREVAGDKREVAGDKEASLELRSQLVTFETLHAAVCGTGPTENSKNGRNARTTLSRTELAVRFKVLTHDAASFPGDREADAAAHRDVSCSLLDAFHATLRALRGVHLQRAGEGSQAATRDEPYGRAGGVVHPQEGDAGSGWLDPARGWTLRWLRAARRIGLVYPLTGGVVNLMGTITEYLAEDFEGFADLLPGIELLVHRAERLADDLDDAQEKPGAKAVALSIRTLRYEYGALERMATARGRRDHPLRPPKATLSFEGRAGYRVARDGFVAFIDAIRQAFDRSGPVFVHDTVRGETSMESPESGTSSVQISPMVLVHPIHWCYAHEIAHLLAKEGRPQGWDDPEEARLPSPERCGKRLVEALVTAGVPLQIKDGSSPTYAYLMQGVRNLGKRCLESENAELGGQVSGDLFEALHHCVEEVFADLLQWALVGPGELIDRAERLFFVLGPSLIHGTRGMTGAAVPSRATLMQLVLRCCVVSAVAAGAGADHTLLGTVLALLEVHAGDGSSFTDESARMLADAVDDRLTALRDDLDVPHERWTDAVTGIREDLEALRSKAALNVAPGTSPKVTALVEPVVAYLELIRGLAERVTCWVHSQWQGAPLRPLRLFDGYIGALMELAPEARPWPLHVEGHVFECRSAEDRLLDPRGDARLALSRRGGVIVRDDAKGDRSFRSRYTLDKLQFLLRLEECARVRRRAQVLVYSQLPPDEAT